MRKKFYFLYRTTHNITGEFYIGKHETYDLNDGYCGSGVWVKSITNRKQLTVERLRFFETSAELDRAERAEIKKYFEHPKNKNISSPSSAYYLVFEDDLISRRACKKVPESIKRRVFNYTYGSYSKTKAQIGAILVLDSNSIELILQEFDEKIIKSASIVLEELHQRYKKHYGEPFFSVPYYSMFSKISKELKIGHCAVQSRIYQLRLIQ
jgi:hypothetical protein